MSTSSFRFAFKSGSFSRTYSDTDPAGGKQPVNHDAESRRESVCTGKSKSNRKEPILPK